MNCFEFRKLALSDPYSEEPNFVKHGLECDDCAAHIASVIAMDDGLRDALSIKVPDDMKARLKLRQVLEKEKTSNQRFRRFAYAASALMTVGLATLAFQNHRLNERYLAYHNAAIEHVEYEVASLNAVQSTAQSRMKAHLASLTGVKINGEVPGLVYSQLCPVLGHDTWHAVVETTRGDKVTLIFFNDKKLPRKSLKKDGWDSKVISVEQGDVLLIGKSKKALEMAEKTVHESISI